jgi:hypothetical protein
MISAHATKGTTSTATFSLLVHMGGRRGVALVDSGSTDSFLDYTFASKTNCAMIFCNSLKMNVAGGGHLDTCAITSLTP